MKRLFFFLAALISFVCSFSQIKIRTKKYPGLLWEISGNGLKKPSFLFGTMHVSSKVVFNLADSFYLGIKNANIVALETNPESWQEDMSRYDISTPGYGRGFRYGNFEGMPNDYISIHTLEFGKYEKKIEQALYTNPSVINNLLYRTYGETSADFEENTYLDMYIYQVGKKWGKRVAGVENYGESMKLMMEAYKDAAKDKNKKERSYDGDNANGTDKLQEAYRTGNLDLLDSLNKLQSFSAAFDEKFLYRRNAIQAGSIDSILKTGSSLFVGVGAAHLPGNRGVIEMLRDKGYVLRPVTMEKRNDGKQKETVEKIHVPVLFHTSYAEDGFFQVDVPGKLYRTDDDYGMTDQQQFADMANGSYYTVTRLRTNNVMWGYSIPQVYKKIDSVLYENIPGKILVKQAIYKNGYKGFDIVNRTRRGDVQRYNIFVTPFEIIFFKMSGNDNYVLDGVEANRFFNSIRLREFVSTGAWKKYTPSFGGFSVSLPHDAFISNDGSWLFDAEDKPNNATYRIVRSDIHNYHFIGEDTFDLSLMEESFRSSEFIDRELSRSFTMQNGYPALNCNFLNKDGSNFSTRFIIQGPHYYALIAHYSRETKGPADFLNSFRILPFHYGLSRERRDTALYFTVQSPVFPESKKEKLEFGNTYDNPDNDDDDDADEKNKLEKGAYRNILIKDDSTGEKIYVSFYKMGRYRMEKDSNRMDEKDFKSYLGGDSAWVIKDLKKESVPGKYRSWAYVLAKKGSSRIFRKKDFYRNGIFFSMVTQSDTLTAPDTFQQRFFSTFVPSDSITGISPFIKKSDFFFGDFFSSDSVARKRAINNIGEIELDATDLPLVKRAIESLTWKQKKYLEVKKTLINKLKNIGTKDASAYLKGIYYAAGDTVELQYTALETLLQQQTASSMKVFLEIITLEPPVLQPRNGNDWSKYTNINLSPYSKKYQVSNGDFMDELYDSLKLTRTILPGLLPLLTLDDYKWPVMKLLAAMVDSGLVRKKDYDSYFNKFLLEAKLELKKQVIAEKKKSIRKAEESAGKKSPASYSLFDGTSEPADQGNDDLSIYATLLLPYRGNNPAVQALFTQLLQSSDVKLKYSTMLLLLRNQQPVPDTLAASFAAMEDYRYDLYSDLAEIGSAALFPEKYNNHLDLAEGKLRATKLYDKPDSLLFVDSLVANISGTNGQLYFFKYKQKKDDAYWKLAVVGPVPINPAVFEWEVSSAVSDDDDEEEGASAADLTQLTNKKIKDDEPLADQLKDAMKEILFSTHKSAREFYDSKNNDGEESPRRGR